MQEAEAVVFVIGSGGSGKTCLLSALRGMAPPILYRRTAEEWTICKIGNDSNEARTLKFVEVGTDQQVIFLDYYKKSDVTLITVDSTNLESLKFASTLMLMASTVDCMRAKSRLLVVLTKCDKISRITEFARLGSYEHVSASVRLDVGIREIRRKIIQMIPKRSASTGFQEKLCQFRRQISCPIISRTARTQRKDITRFMRSASSEADETSMGNATSHYKKEKRVRFKNITEVRCTEFEDSPISRKAEHNFSESVSNCVITASKHIGDALDRISVAFTSLTEQEHVASATN